VAIFTEGRFVPAGVAFVDAVVEGCFLAGAVVVHVSGPFFVVVPLQSHRW